MKLIVAIVQKDDAGELEEALRAGGFASTRTSSTGGFLRRGNVTFGMRVDESEIDSRLALIKAHCKKRTVPVNSMPTAPGQAEWYASEPMQVEIGGAVIFILNLDRFERF